MLPLQSYCYFIDMKKKKNVLFIYQEISPYLPETKVSEMGRLLPQGIQEKGKDIRTFMPKYGCINERRNQLHEVIRLSGMNLIINDTDHPLIIKVASIQAARMQVYFIDNDDYFMRKETITDEDGNFFNDNDERAIFFSKGVFETVKKLRWKPDLIYCQGWMSALVPILLKKEYNEEPIFANTKVIYSTSDDYFKEEFNKDFAEKACTENIGIEDLKELENPNYKTINELAFRFADGIVINDRNEVNEEVKNSAMSTSKPIFINEDDENYVDNIDSFIDSILVKS